MFASIIAALSWPTVVGKHWSGPALWYAGVVFALVAIVLGAQQTMVLSDACQNPNNVSKVRKNLMRGSARRERPGRTVLFALQAPLMCLAYSIVLFLAGLTSIVLSPLAQNPGWNAEAKVGGPQ